MSSGEDLNYGAQEKVIEQGRLDLEAAKELIIFRLDRLRADLDAIQKMHDQSLEHWMRYVDEKFRGVDQRTADLMAAYEQRMVDRDLRATMDRSTR